MRKIPLLAILGLLLALLPIFARADGDKPKKEDTELEKSMDVMSKAWRKLRKQADDPAQNFGSLELVATLRTAAKNNLKFTPDLARDIPADKRDKLVAGYQAKMKELIAAFDQLETAFKANDNPAALGLIDKISAIQKEGHRSYKRPE